MGLICCCCKKSEPNLRDKEKNQDLTTKNSLTHSAIEELKSKLITKDIDSDGTITMIPETQRNTNSHIPNPHMDEEGLILPRKPANPVKENPERQSLHKELAFNQKIGKKILNQKSELQKALEKQKENLAKKEMEIHIATNQPELEKVIAERAKRLQENNHIQNEDDKCINNEILQARLKLKARSDSK